MLSRNDSLQKKPDGGKRLIAIALGSIALVMLCAALRATAQDNKSPYPSMAPIDQYLMDQGAEVALARRRTTFMVPVRMWSDGTPDIPH